MIRGIRIELFELSEYLELKCPLFHSVEIKGQYGEVGALKELKIWKEKQRRQRWPLSRDLGQRLGDRVENLAGEPIHSHQQQSGLQNTS